MAPEEIGENLPHHRLAWKVKRLAWVVMALILLAALAGLLGPGPLSKASARLNGGIDLKYDRHVRYNSPTHFELTTPPGPDDLNISLNTDFIAKIDLEKIDPEPAEIKLDGPRHIYVFKRTTSQEQGMIRFTYRPNAYGMNRGKLEVGGVGAINFQQFIFP